MKFFKRKKNNSTTQSTTTKSHAPSHSQLGLSAVSSSSPSSLPHDHHEHMLSLSTVRTSGQSSVNVAIEDQQRQQHQQQFTVSTSNNPFDADEHDQPFVHNPFDEHDDDDEYERRNNVNHNTGAYSSMVTSSLLNPFVDDNDEPIQNNDNLNHRRSLLSSSLPSSSSSTKSTNMTTSPIDILPRPTSPPIAAQNLSTILRQLYEYETYSHQIQYQQQQQQLNPPNSNTTNPFDNNDGGRNSTGIANVDVGQYCHQIVDCMDIDPDLVVLQREGCRALGLLSSLSIVDTSVDNDVLSHHMDTTTTGRGGRVSISRRHNKTTMSIHSSQRVIPVIFRAMELHPDEVDIQDHAMAALAILTRLDVNTQTILNADVNASHLEEVLVAMEEFPAHEGIPSYGLHIFSNVAKSIVRKRRHEEVEWEEQQRQRQHSQPNGQGTITHRTSLNSSSSSTADDFPQSVTNAIPTVLQLLKDYRDNGMMYETGLSALVHLTTMNPAGQALLAKQPQSISVLLKASSDNERFGPDVFRGQSDDDDDDDERGGGVVDLDEDHDLMLQRKKIRLYALQVLENVSSHPSLEVKGKIILQGAVTSIVNALREMSTVPPIMPAIDRISDISFESSASELMMAVYTSAVTDTIVACLRTLVNLSSSGSNASTAGTSITGRPSSSRGSFGSKGSDRLSSSSLNMSASSNEENKRILSKTATKIVLTIVRQHNVIDTPASCEILVQSFCLFRNLSSPVDTDIDKKKRSSMNNGSSPAAELLTSNGGINTLLICMREHTSHEMIQIQACATLANLLLLTNNSAGGYDMIHSLHAEEGITTIFETIRLHQANLAVLEQAFGALYYLICSRDLLPDQKQQLLLEENLLVVLATMQQNIDVSELLCTRGCGLVLLLSAFAGSRDSPAKDAIVSVGGVSIILAMMRRHGLNVEVCEYATGFLRGICLDPKYHREVVEEEAIASVLSSMMVHPHEAAIQAYGCDFLIHLANADPDYHRAIQDGNGCAVASDALKNHRSNRVIQARGATLVTLLS